MTVRDAGSRSHTVYTVKLVKEELISQNGTRERETTIVTAGEMKFVDLVGVERVKC